MAERVLIDRTALAAEYNRAAAHRFLAVPAESSILSLALGNLGVTVVKVADYWHWDSIWPIDKFQPVTDIITSPLPPSTRRRMKNSIGIYTLRGPF